MANGLFTSDAVSRTQSNFIRQESDVDEHFAKRNCPPL
jgi:hypothetical protein